MSRRITITTRDDGVAPKARVARPGAKWSSCTCGRMHAARRAAAKELGCSEGDVSLWDITGDGIVFGAERKSTTGGAS